MGLTDTNLGQRWRQMRFNPIRSLTPQTLAAALDEFDAGYLRRAALLWEAIEDRDDTLKLAAPKRRKSVSRRPWQILKVDDSRQAKRHAETLTHFYNHVTATDALDQNVRGGFSLLIRQMMDAQFKRYAVHEIIWQPQAGGKMTAEFKFVPLYFFENRTGRLRYTGSEGVTDGLPLAPNEWMVTVGDGLMSAASICYMFKRLSLQDWLNFSEKFGIPGVQGKTSAAPGSKEYNDFCDALARFANDWITVTDQQGSIELIEASKTGDAPFAPMVERMDRRMIALCRGADLGTLSDKDATGASLQQEESDLLLEDDCELCAETLGTQVSRFVIQQIYGPVEPLAYLHIDPPVRQDVKTDIEVDRFLLDVGGALSAQETFERYGRTLPSDFPEDAVLRASGSSRNEPEPKAGEDPDASAENDAIARAAEAVGIPQDWLAPIGTLLAELGREFGEGEEVPVVRIVTALEQAQTRLPEIFADMDIEAFTGVLEGALGTAALEGARQGIRKLKTAAA